MGVRSNVLVTLFTVSFRCRVKRLSVVVITVRGEQAAIFRLAFVLRSLCLYRLPCYSDRLSLMKENGAALALLMHKIRIACVAPGNTVSEANSVLVIAVSFGVCVCVYAIFITSPLRLQRFIR